MTAASTRQGSAFFFIKNTSLPFLIYSKIFFASSDSHKVDALVDSIAYKQLKYYGFSRIFEKQVFWTSEKDFSE
jgi:hypothetical protein